MTPGERKKEELASLRVQLAQLNARANHQEDHAWKMPLALAAVAGTILFQSIGKPAIWIGVAAALTVLFLVAAALHFMIVLSGIHHTVGEIHKIERMLGLPGTHLEEKERVSSMLPRLH